MPGFGPLNAGELRHKIQIMKKSSTQDENGTVFPYWSEYYHTMAAYMPQQGREYFQDQSLNAILNVIFRTRWSPYENQPDTTMKVYSPFGRFNINAVVDVDGLHKELQIICTREVQAG